MNTTSTKVITGRNTVMSYLNVTEPKAPIGGGTPKYSVSLIIPKSDTGTVEKIKAAIKAAFFMFVCFLSPEPSGSKYPSDSAADRRSQPPAGCEEAFPSLYPV